MIQIESYDAAPEATADRDFYKLTDIVFLTLLDWAKWVNDVMAMHPTSVFDQNFSNGSVTVYVMNRKYVCKAI